MLLSVVNIMPKSNANLASTFNLHHISKFSSEWILDLAPSAHITPSVIFQNSCYLYPSFEYDRAKLGLLEVNLDTKVTFDVCNLKFIVMFCLLCYGFPNICE